MMRALVSLLAFYWGCLCLGALFWMAERETRAQAKPHPLDLPEPLKGRMQGRV